MSPTLVTALVVTVLFSQRHAGFLLMLLSLLLLPWLLYSAYVIVRRPQQRWYQLSKIAIWSIAVLTVIGVHYYLNVSTRARADAVLQLIRQYSKTHGVCPSNLEAIGLFRAQLREQLGPSGYWCKEGEMTFFYGSTFAPFDTQWYDFKLGRWSYRND